MKHIMAADARWRFTFGITIKNTSLGLWYANRSMLVGSKPLNIIMVLKPCLLVFYLSSVSIEQGTLAEGTLVLCIRVRPGHGLGSFG